MSAYNWIIRGGRVIDPANRIDAVRDLAIRDGRIAAVAEALDSAEARAVYDARGQIVTPGLVDVHVHAYHLVTPLGVDVDHYCLGRGVTTAVDAGSAGSATLPGFRAYIAQRVKTRVLAFMNISCAGLAFAGIGGTDIPGELDSLGLADVKGCLDAVERNRDLVVGVKLRLSESVAAGGRNEAEAYRRALDAAAAARVPLMVHHTLSSIPLEDCPGRMRPGDLYTHCYQGFQSTIIDPASRRIDPAALAARRQGVVFDLGHGQGSFNWTVAEICAREGFWPDTISTDMHSGTCEGPAYDLPTVMTRLLHLGLPLPEVVRRCTVDAARAIGWHERIGTLDIGREADVSVFSLEEIELDLEDCQSQMRRVHRRLIPKAVWRAGVRGEITSPRRFPNRDTIAAQRAWWDRLLIRDEPHGVSSV